jgi:hypothetical protein
MKCSSPVAWFRKLALPCIVTIFAALTGCVGGQEATPEALQSAKERWANAGITDYDLEWTVAGSQSNHYHVTVRASEVRKVESVRPDGQRIALKPGAPRFYSVDGLFLTIADELAQMKTDHPFGQPQGTKVVMRFKSDPDLGYPQWYRRDVMGTSLSIVIDVVKLLPLTPTSN